MQVLLPRANRCHSETSMHYIDNEFLQLSDRFLIQLASMAVG